MENSQKDLYSFAEGSFFIKLTKICEENQVRNVLFFRCMTSLTPNLKLCNFRTLWKLIKLPQNFVQVSFYILLTKICHKDRAVLASVLLQGPKNLRIKHSNKMITRHLNVNSIRNKFNLLSSLTDSMIDILMTSERKFDAICPTNQFFIQGYSHLSILSITLNI